jgi:hypothetical protein
VRAEFAKYFARMFVRAGVRINAALNTESLPLREDPSIQWFGAGACVVRRDGTARVFIGGTQVGSFSDRDSAQRNTMLVGLAGDSKVHLGQLAKAFGVTSETLRLLRRLHESQGLQPLLERQRGGRAWKVTQAHHRRLERLFSQGASIDAAHAKVPTLSRTTVATLRRAWHQKQLPSEPRPALTLVAPVQGELALASGGAGGSAAAASASEQARVVPEDPEEEAGGRAARSVVSADAVQHLGTWLLVSMVESLGLYERAARAAQARVAPASLRLALDGVVMALALGEACVEGVRRLATPSAPWLLCAPRAPSTTGARRTLGVLAQEGGAAALHLGMVRGYLEQARLAASGPGPVFYVDNHLRPYRGKHTLRKGWRMQDKRVQPGASDYYLHDEDGRPLGRISAPAHGALTDFLSPIAHRLRLALPQERILLAFDRAGSFPAQLAQLRDEGFECVTYERKPYPTLASTYFTETWELDGERIGVAEARVNLGKGRGRVRRICLRMGNGRQVNLLAVSKRSARQLVDIMRGRWRQENAFKHGVERWGINQLDSRRVTPYAPGTVIPNPARRRLDRALQVARVKEGLARAALARLGEGDAGRAALERDIAEALEAQTTYEAQRPTTPARAALENTELAGKLVHHAQDYKMLLDTVRLACANAESELAAELGVFLPRPAEAKKTLANLFAAPGRIQVSAKTITVTLAPAGTRCELEAFAQTLRQVNEARLRLPADQQARSLRFRIAQIS